MTPRYFRFACPRRGAWFWYECDATGDALNIDQYVGPYPSYDAAFYAAGNEPLIARESAAVEA
jgi:hypothetical protein